MMLALEATTSVLDRKLQQPSQTPADRPQRWAMRRWSLHGTDDTGTRNKSRKSNSPTATARATPAPPSITVAPPLPLTESETEKRKRSRSVDMSPLQSSLKKAPAVLTAKLAQCVEAMGLRDALHRYKKSSADTTKEDQDDAFHLPARNANSKGRRVHFPSSPAHFKQVFECPATTAEEKKQCHYTRDELMDMVLEAKECLARERRFSSQPDNTIFEQGYLTLPNELHFFHHKRYYCILKARELLCYASPAHASKNVNVKCKIPILKVQECSTMSNQAKIAAFGANLPPTLPLMFFVTRADGERVLFAAESRSTKKSWVHTLLRLTQVQEVLPPCLLRETSTTSSASTCRSEEDSGHSSSEEEESEDKKTPLDTPEDNTCESRVAEDHECNNDESRT